jgi:hypothetical protein
MEEMATEGEEWLGEGIEGGMVGIEGKGRKQPGATSTQTCNPVYAPY